MNRRGKVFFNHVYCGYIEENSEGYVFEYDGDYLTNPSSLPVSLTLPTTKKKYISHTLFPFFDGLIPEGYLLEISIRNWKLDPNDRMGLLLSVCADPIGAVSVRRSDE